MYLAAAHIARGTSLAAFGGFLCCPPRPLAISFGSEVHSTVCFCTNRLFVLSISSLPDGTPWLLYKSGWRTYRTQLPMTLLARENRSKTLLEAWKRRCDDENPACEGILIYVHIIKYLLLYFTSYRDTLGRPQKYYIFKRSYQTVWPHKSLKKNGPPKESRLFITPKMCQHLSICCRLKSSCSSGDVQFTACTYIYTYVSTVNTTTTSSRCSHLRRTHAWS